MICRLEDMDDSDIDVADLFDGIPPASGSVAVQAHVQPGKVVDFMRPWMAL